MFHSINKYRYAQLLLCLSTLLCASGCVISGARNLQGTPGTPPKVGLRINRVFEGGNAQRAGLHAMDVITKYGDFDIVDDATYFAARDHYQNSRDDVQLVAWRGVYRITPTVHPGKLGIDSSEYNPVISEFLSIMDKLDAMRQIPQYQHDREFKFEFTDPPDKVLAKARALIDRAAQEGTLTPNQALVSRIYMILDDAEPASIKQQSDLLAQFLSTQPDSYVEYIGSDVFFEKKRYRPAIGCFKQHLKVEPDNVSLWLNLGVASNHLGMFDEADAAADYVVAHKMGVSDYGMIVLLQVKATAALGRHDYDKSSAYAEKVFEVNRKPYDISLVQFAAAQTGDLGKLAEATRKFQQVLPAEFEKRKYQADAIEAYALVRTNQRDRARQLVMKWKDGDRIEGRVREYWSMYPGGEVVARNWKELSTN